MKPLRIATSLWLVIAAGAVQAVAGAVTGNIVQGLMGAIVAYLAHRLGDLAVHASGMSQCATELIRHNEALCRVCRAQSQLIQTLMDDNQRLVAAGRNQP